jgi:RHS repeat-associated protein
MALVFCMNAYFYGTDRIAQLPAPDPQKADYFLGDALGSVRQMADESGAVDYMASYDPYGDVLSTNGEAQTDYGYTNEYTDATGMVYLRARDYDPLLGIFLSKDPSGLEQNSHLYANASPVQKSDPTGLFSRAQIAKSFGFDSFESVVAYYENHGKHWGYLAALLRALPGDTIDSADVGIGPIFGEPTKMYRHFDIGYSDNVGITYNNMPLNSDDYLHLPPTFGGNGNPWRGEDASYYSVSSMFPYGTENYVDGGDTTTWPDFWAISASFDFFQGIFMTDIYGNQYFTPGVTSSEAGLSYVEEYVALPYSTGATHGNTSWYLPEETLKNHLERWGGCFSGDATLIVGVGGTICLNQNFISMYSVGAQLGINVSFAPYTFFRGKDPSQGWYWAVEDRLNGIKRQDLDRIEENAYTGCNDIPHLTRP